MNLGLGMSKRSKSIIRSQYQTRRTRLLYFIYESHGRKIKNDQGIKSRLRRAFEYKSDGHLYHDLKYLIEQGLLEEINGYYKVTKAGRQEFTLLSTLQLATLASFFIGFYIIFVPLAQMLAFLILLQGIFVMLFFLGMGLVMIGYGAIYWISLRAFQPRSPDLKDELSK